MAKNVETIVLPFEPNLESMLALWILKRNGAKAFRGLQTAKIVSRKTLTALYSTDFVLSKEQLGDCVSLPEKVSSLCGNGDDQVLEKFIVWCMKTEENQSLSELKKDIGSLSLAKAVKASMYVFDTLFAETLVTEKSKEKPDAITASTLMRAMRVGKIPKERTIRLRHPDGNEKILGFAVDEGPFKLDDSIDLAVVINKDATKLSIVSNFSIRSVIRVLRIEELVHKQRSEKTALLASRMHREFAQEGIAPLVPEWNYYKMHQGTRHVITTGIETLFTKLQVADIMSLIRIAVDNRFQPQREHLCLRFRCMATVDFPCPWYHWMLGKCRQVRNAGTMERQTIARERAKKIS